MRAHAPGQGQLGEGAIGVGLLARTWSNDVLGIANKLAIVSSSGAAGETHSPLALCWVAAAAIVGG